MEILNWILAVFSALCGGSTIITLFIYRKQQKRFKTAEAFEKEVTALQASVTLMQGQIKFLNDSLTDMQKLVIEKDAYISTLSTDNQVLEVKHVKYKSVINQAYSCAYCEDKANCPVLKRRAKNEEAYLNEISRTT